MILGKVNLPSNLWKSPVIKERLLQEAYFEGANVGVSDKKHYWVLVPFADSKDGLTVLQNYKASIQDADPHELQKEFAEKIFRTLQQQAHFDGLWLVGWTHPPTSYGVLTDLENCWNRLIAIWHDQHGDPQYTVESDLPFMAQLEAGVDYYVDMAHQSHEQWLKMYGPKVMKSDMMLKDSQMRPEALEALKRPN